MFSSQEKLFQPQNEISALNQPKIVKTLFILDKNRRYSFDVNQNITIRLLKNMIDAAANLNRAHLRIFHEGKEYTSYDDSTLEILFPDLNLVIFSLTVSFDSFEVYDNLISLKLNKEYCPLHFSKYPYFYCFTCGKSICFECVKSNGHKNHDYKEKYDTHAINDIEKSFYRITKKTYLRSETTYFWQIFINTIHQYILY